MSEMNLPNDEAVKRISDLASLQVALEVKIDKTEEDLLALKKSLRDISEFKLPELMTEIGMSEFKLVNGAKITIQPICNGKMDDTNREPCIDWLVENGHGAILKSTLELNFNKGEKLDYEAISALINGALKQLDLQYKQKLDRGVHYATLNAFIKEQITNGEQFPMELFKVYLGRKTKITIN
jgi:hypothetical protein